MLCTPEKKTLKSIAEITVTKGGGGLSLFK